ncbi:MAG: autotransporter outer membrane beta-barrel domain-containing protein, partial [Sutterella sp.]
VSADSRISAMGAAFDLGFSPKSKLTSTYNTVELGEVNADYAYGSVVFAHAGTSFTLADSSIIRLDGAMVNDVALVNVIDMTDLGETGTAPTGGVTLKDGAAVYLKNAVVMNRVDGVVGDVTVEGKAKLDATGVNRIGGLGSEFKTIVLHVGEENAVAAPQAAVFARSARASASNAVLVFTSSQTLNGVDVTVDGLPGTLGNDYNILGAENNAVVNLSGSMTFEGTFQQVTQNLTNAVITADDPLSAAEVINAVPSEPDPEDPTAPVEPEAPVVTLTGNVKTLAESLLGSVALVNQGADFIANEGIAAMNDAAKADTVTEFGAMHAGSLRYETGSHVDLDGGALALGAVTKVGNSTLAAFFGSGWADSESHVEGAKADGDHAYYGLGVAARWQAEAPFYVDGSFRIGLSKTEFNGLYASTGEKAHYDAKSLYTSAHVGAGYLVKLTAKTTLDAYGKYILSYLGSDDVGLGTSGGEKLKLDSTTAHTLQAGLRLTGKCTESFAWRLGAAYEHVFDGDAESRISAVGIAEQRIDAPSISGNTGIFEIGAKYIPAEASAWTFDFGLKGNVGDRRGVTGSAQALYRF